MIDRQVLDKWAPRLLSVLRIVTGLLFLEHGTAKFFSIPHVEFLANTPVFSLFGNRRRAGTGRREPHHSRPLHAAGRLHPVRRDGFRLFPRARRGELLPAPQPGRVPRPCCSASSSSTWPRRAAGRGVWTRCGAGQASGALPSPGGRGCRPPGPAFGRPKDRLRRRVRGYGVFGEAPFGGRATPHPAAPPSHLLPLGEG